MPVELSFYRFSCSFSSLCSQGFFVLMDCVFVGCEIYGTPIDSSFMDGLFIKDELLWWFIWFFYICWGCICIEFWILFWLYVAFVLFFELSILWLVLMVPELWPPWLPDLCDILDLCWPFEPMAAVANEFFYFYDMELIWSFEPIVCTVCCYNVLRLYSTLDSWVSLSFSSFYVTNSPPVPSLTFISDEESCYIMYFVLFFCFWLTL